MNTFFSRIGIALIALLFVTEGVSAYSQNIRIKQKKNPRSYITTYDQYYDQGYDNRPVYNRNPNSVVCPNFSSVSVGVGNVADGVNISVVSTDAHLQNCIKNTAWNSYFTRFGSNVNVNVSNTTQGVQIIATSYDRYTATELQNTRWNSIITGISAYSYGYSNTYQNPYYSQNTYSPYYQNPYYQTPYYPPTTYNPYLPPYYQNPVNQIPYRTGTQIFGGNTQYMNRSLINTGNGVKMYLTSPDYNTTLYIQRLSFSDIFSARLTGVSISQSAIAGGLEVTVTSGNTSTIAEIQNMAYELMYR